MPEGENDSNSGWGQNREWSEDFGGWCDEYSDGTCTRVVSVETVSTDIPQNGGPGGSYWGNGDGSGIGMRGWGDVMQEGLALKAKHQFQEELAFQRAMGRTCTANGLCTLPGIANLNADTRREYAERIKLGLSFVPVLGGLVDGVDLADAAQDGDGVAAAMAIAGIAMSVLPPLKVAAKGGAVAAELAEQAMKHGDEVADAAKGGSVVFHRYDDVGGPTGRHVTAEIRDASGRSLGEFHQAGIKQARIEPATDYVGKTASVSTPALPIANPKEAARFGASGADAGRWRRTTNDCVTGACAIANEGVPSGGHISPSQIRSQLGI